MYDFATDPICISLYIYEENFVFFFINANKLLCIKHQQASRKKYCTPIAIPKKEKKEK
jgi:hypothetical protein